MRKIFVILSLTLASTTLYGCSSVQERLGEAEETFEMKQEVMDYIDLREELLEHFENFSEIVDSFFEEEDFSLAFDSLEGEIIPGIKEELNNLKEVDQLDEEVNKVHHKLIDAMEKQQKAFELYKEAMLTEDAAENEAKWNEANVIYEEAMDTYDTSDSLLKDLIEKYEVNAEFEE